MGLWAIAWVGTLKGVVSTVSQVAAGRQRGAFILNAARVFSMIFSGVSYFLDAATLAKMNVTSAATNPMLNELVAPEQLEEKFGGSAPNRQDGEYWPPRLPSDVFGTEDIIVRDTVAAGNV